MNVELTVPRFIPFTDKSKNTINNAVMGLKQKLVALFSNRKSPENEMEAIERFQKETEDAMEYLEAPIECDQAADALIKITAPYGRLLRVTDRFPEDSESYQKVFQSALIPTLDKISSVSSSHECFKNKRFKKAFDKFIRTAQQKARD